MAASRSAIARANKGAERHTSGASFVKNTGNVLLYGALVVVAVIFMFPFFWTVSSSFKAPYEILSFPPVIFPAVPQWHNYVRVFELSPFARWIGNTLFVVVLATTGVVLSASVVAYSFARFNYRGKNLIFLLTLGTMMLPSQVTLIPQFILFNKLGFVNTLYPLWVTQWFGGGAFFIFLLRQFFLTLPRDLDEAALIDGANRFRILWNVLLPLCIPALATVAIISFIDSWGDFLTPLIYLNRQLQFTLALGLSFFRNYPESGGLPQQHLLMAASVMTTLPPIALFFSAQRYFVRGIVLSGIKG
jgi:multiple sugar transport system permease protein